MTYPQITYVSITLSKNYFRYQIFYKSGRRISKFTYINATEKLLYPISVVKENHAVMHIVERMEQCGALPKSVKKWISEKHPQAEFTNNPYDENILQYYFADDTYAMGVSSLSEMVNY